MLEGVLRCGGWLFVVVMRGVLPCTALRLGLCVEKKVKDQDRVLIAGHPAEVPFNQTARRVRADHAYSMFLSHSSLMKLC